MAEFIETEALDVDLGSHVAESDNGEYVSTVSDEEFIDDNSEQSNQSEYFANVTRNYSDVVEQHMRDIENCTDLEARHYFDSDEAETTWHDFSNFEGKVKLFKKSLNLPHGIENPDSFFYSILYAIRHNFTEKVDFLQDEENLKKDVGIALSNDLFEIKSLLRLDGQDKLNFENQCFKVNTILSRYNLFLRVFELKDKFRYLIKQDSVQNKHFRELSACIIERFNGFQIVRLEFDNEIRKDFKPINIIYKPVIKLNSIIDCFFTTQLHLAFKAVYNETSNWKKIKSCCAFECYFCGKFFVRKAKRDIVWVSRVLFTILKREIY